MKLKNLRQKYNGLLEKFIRLFTLSGIAFVVTACYGTAPLDHEEYLDVQGQILDEDDLPLESIQVVVKSQNEYHNRLDTIYTAKDGRFHGQYPIPYFYSDTIEVVAHDTTGVYASDSVRIPYHNVEFGRHEDNGRDSYTTYYTLETDLQLKKK